MAEIVIDQKVRFGKPVVKGTRITVDEILGALASGMTYADVEKEYGVNKEDILAAIHYASEIVSEEEVGVIKA